MVYRIPCTDCDRVYIGQRGEYLDTRLKKHKRDISSKHINNDKAKSTLTVLAEHACT